jgi:hypothetical protein
VGVRPSAYPDMIGEAFPDAPPSKVRIIRANKCHLMCYEEVRT